MLWLILCVVPLVSATVVRQDPVLNIGLWLWLSCTSPSSLSLPVPSHTTHYLALSRAYCIAHIARGRMYPRLRYRPDFSHDSGVLNQYPKSCQPCVLCVVSWREGGREGGREGERERERERERGREGGRERERERVGQQSVHDIDERHIA
jgi:hypothetical protein